MDLFLKLYDKEGQSLEVTNYSGEAKAPAVQFLMMDKDNSEKESIFLHKKQVKQLYFELGRYLLEDE